MGWIEGNRKDLNIVLFPFLELVRQSAQEGAQLKITSYGFGKNHGAAQITAENHQPSYSLNGNVLTVPAQQADKENRWKGTLGELKLYVPSEYTVIVRKPVNHEFGKTPSKSVHEFGGWWNDGHHNVIVDNDWDWDSDWD